MAIYYNQGSEKYPLDKLNIFWDSVTLTDRVDFSECIFRLFPDFVALYGILGSDCIGIQKSKDKNWRADGALAALFVHREKKEVWDTSVGKFVTQNVSKDENYLFVRLTDALTTLPADSRITLSSIPLPNPAVQQLINQNNPSLTNMIEEMLSSIVKVGIASTSALDLTKLKDFEDAIEKISNGGNGFKKSGGNYTPPETEAARLNARWQFIQKQFAGFVGAEVSTLVELMIIIDSQQEPDKTIAKAALGNLIHLIAK